MQLENNLKLRLASGFAVLQLIDRRRAQTGDPTIGAGIERQIVNQELRSLEAECAASSDQEMRS